MPAPARGSRSTGWQIRGGRRLLEQNRGRVSPHLQAYANAVGDGEVLRMVAVRPGIVQADGVRRGARVLWALDGRTGPVQPVDSRLALRGKALLAQVAGGRDIPLTGLLDISRHEQGWFRVAAFAPAVSTDEGAPRMTQVVGALLRVPAPEAERATAIWLLALVVFLLFAVASGLAPGRQGLALAGVLTALVAVTSVWVPRQLAIAHRGALADRAEDLLAVQQKADALEPVALVSPIANRELWSPDGALRLERVPADRPPSDIEAGADRVGGPTASVHVHPAIRPALAGHLRADVTLWALLGALLLGLIVTPTARLLHGLRTQPGTYSYVAPALVGMLVLVIVPFVTGVGLSFYRYHLEGNAYEAIGFGNFAEILAPAAGSDIYFWRTFGVTVLWTASNVFLHVAIGLGLALVLNRPGLRAKGLYRVLLILPWAIPSYITALMWRSMFVGEAGPINRLLGVVGVAPVAWFDDHFWTNFVPNLVTNTWLGFPFMMVVALGALQSIPRDLYEAAGLDGAGAWQRFRHVTLPLLKPALLPAVILGTIWTFNLFNVIYLVSMGSGHTEILITEAYRAFHEQHRHGFAAASAVLIFCILLAYSVVTTRVSKAAEGALQ